VTLNRSSAVIVQGETVQLFATVVPTSTKATGVKGTSSDESVATVGEHGRIETKGLGTAAITVTTDSGGKTAVCAIEVVESTATPSGGSMIIGAANTTYGASGGTATVPLTVIVPTDRPIFDFVFDIAVGTAATANYSITGIALDGVPLTGNNTTT
jgi:hypothetical protein